MKLRMDKNGLLYYKSALELGLPCTPIADIYGFAVTLDNRQYFFRGGHTPFNNGGSVSVARNKYCVNKLLAAAGIPVPKTIAITRDEFATGNYSLHNLNFPLVAKPTSDSGLGKDVLCNIKNEEILLSYLKKKFKRYSCISIEEFHNHLKTYRILVFYNEVIGTLERTPSHIIGDGTHTISELIAIANQERQSTDLGPLKVDEEYLIRLDELGLTLKDIPEMGEYVQLCYTCNGSRGGTRTSLGKQICQENAELAVRAAKVLNLNLVGFDVLCKDINVSMTKCNGVFIEANYNPDIAMHETCMLGTPQHVSKIIMRKLIYLHPFSYLKYQIKKCRWSNLFIFVLVLLYLQY